MAVEFHSFADLIDERVRSRRAPTAPIATVLPVEDDQHEADPTAELGYAEGQSFIIEYVDSRQNLSLRRITVWGLRTGVGGVPLLVAQCHERQAERTFRVDRIQACMDYDGVVHTDVSAYLSDVFGMAPALVRRQTDQADFDLWNGIRTAIRTDAVVLAALSHSDGLMHPSEVDVAVSHCERASAKKKLYVTEATLASLNAYVRRLHPTVRDVQRATEGLYSATPDEILALLTSAVALIDADRVRHPAELRLINEFAKDLIGVSILE